ncbi:LysR family transcriptional regulator [Hyphomonas polymorpha PS728]|uniref:LysR family transcriptional regulator n=1 Tax=Hyphomonas polymorpha PS728 TaxID=1280954 RepID=A0A062VHC1_9PROT|nr:LysR family transcriptional regulator [Hyphomonas polymorpha]KCZ97929.1 LysR family transcriptional regulator [Hyphomonas polymorpha PS728]
MNSSAAPWDHIRSFLAVLEEGSLSRAARRLSLTQPTLSRHIDQLEVSLGGPLFTRSPRGLIPTDKARMIEPYARTIAASAAAMVRAASGPLSEMTGAVRISASEVVGMELLPGMLAPLREAHPGLSFEIIATNQSSDLLRRDADIAIRMVRPQQAALLARKVGDVELGLFAHRDYLARHGTLNSLEDMAGHALIGFDHETVSVQALRAMGLTLDRADFAWRSDSDLVQLKLALAGAGIGVCQVGLARRAGNMVRLVPDEFSFALETWVTMHEELKGVARMKATFDHLVEAMSQYIRDQECPD